MGRDEPLGVVLRRFWSYPWPEKQKALRNRFKKTWSRVAPGVALPLRLPFGVWFLCGDDICGDRVFAGRYDPDEVAFVSSYLRPGMTALDIGAHQGFYSLLLAKKVGPRGRIVSFEPSSRERSRLERHLRINRLDNVRVEPIALGATEGEVEIHVVAGRNTGLNSLRKPATDEPIVIERVPVKTLDEHAGRLGLSRVDFIKIDVEGGELDVCKGARRVLSTMPRPVILAEISDVRTAPWGYEACEILRFLEGLGYTWLQFAEGGRLIPAPASGPLHVNLLAVPPERRGEVGP